MNKLIASVLFLILFAGQTISAQGVQFDHLTFDEALVKAQNENKPLFIDFHTSWCAPCKAMAANVFTNPAVGALYNKEFICIQLDAEKEGMAAAKKYSVIAYPTLIFVDGKGEMIFRKEGGLDIVKTLKMGNDALTAMSSTFSLAKLKELYPQKLNDERFLKLYIKKLIEYGENPSEGIETWLKVQKSVKENDVDMMEFLLNYRNYLMVDGKAEAILNANLTEYLDIATREEAMKLKGIKALMVDNTMRVAYIHKDIVLMRAFIDNWKELPATESSMDKLKEYELDYLLMKKDIPAYKAMAMCYMDSLITAKPLEKMREEDKAYYDEYKTNRYVPSIVGDATLETLKEGRQANIQFKAIAKTAKNFLNNCETKKEYKKLYKWLDYGATLIPADFTIDNLKADALFKQGKVKDAIKIKEHALAKLPEKDKRRAAVQKELDNMKIKK